MSLNKRRMSPAQAITIELTAEIHLDKHKLGNWTNRWSKVQEDACCPSRIKKSSLNSNGNNAKDNVDLKTT